MLRKIVTTLIGLPLALLLVMFAVANRNFVTLSFDPLNPTDPALSLSLPLFVVLIIFAILGVIAGSAVTWVRQRRWRRAARAFENEARELRGRYDDWRQSLMQTQSASPQAPNTPRSLPPAA